MFKLKLKDKVKLWNGEEGKIIELHPDTMSISFINQDSTPTYRHKMNVRYLNGIEVDASDLTM